MSTTSSSVSPADVLADRARPVANGPEIPGLLEAFWEYERALMADDLPALDALFAPGPDTLRGDAAGLLRGHDAISTFRGGRGGAPKRRIVEVEVRALGEDHAAVVAITELLRG
ncbi:AtzH-like domain-containing protein, partial [Brachybacterium muris]